MCKGEIEDSYETICSRFSDIIPNITDFSAYGLHIDHPLALELSS